jgi:hypothetical protein
MHADDSFVDEIGGSVFFLEWDFSEDKANRFAKEFNMSY